MSTYIGINNIKFLAVLLIVGPFLSACTMTARVTDLVSGKTNSILPAPAIDNTIATGSKPNISFVDSAVTVGEGSSITITINLSAPLATDTQVNLTIGSVSGGDRFNPLPTTFTIPAGVTTVNLVVNTIDDTLVQDSEQWNISITPVSSDIEVNNGTIIATVNDNDGGNTAEPPPATPVPKMLKDMNVYPSALTSINALGKIFFIGSDLEHGEELWISDGTTLGTILLKDIVPGTGNSKISQFFKNSSNTLLYFVAITPAEGEELWKSDGTSAGTTIVKDLEPGALSSYPTLHFSDNDKIYFSADTSASGNELFTSTGSPESTQILFESRPSASGAYGFYSFLKIDNDIYFGVDNSSSASALFKTDGTTLGTVMVTQGSVNYGNFLHEPSGMIKFGSKIIFSASDWTNYEEPYSYDTVSQTTTMLKDIASGFSGSYPVLYNYPINGKIPFSVSYDSNTSTGLWFTDGTAAGTQKLAVSVNASLFWGAINGELIFSSYNPTTFESELWKTDATVGGTVLINDIFPGTTGAVTNSSAPVYGGTLGNQMIFTAQDGINGIELWITDGTTVGTHLLKDINPGTASSSPTSFLKVNNQLVFTATTVNEGLELWVTDGTSNGTRMVKDLAPAGTSSAPIGIVNFNNLGVFFAAYNSQTKYASTFASDLTSGGTVAFGHSRVTTFGSNTTQFIDYNSLVYFNGTDTNKGNGLWSTDGTATGIFKIKDINPNITCTDISNFINFNGSLFFAGSDPISGKELFISDGSNAGTQLVKDIYAGSSGSNPSIFVGSGSYLYFSASDSNGSELWRSDGTSVGTVMIKDHFTGTTTSGNVTYANSGSPSSITKISGSNDIIYLGRTSNTTATFFTSNGAVGNAVSTGVTIYMMSNIFMGPNGLAYLTGWDTSANNKTRIHSYDHTTKAIVNLTPNFNTDIVAGTYFSNRLNKLLWASTNSSNQAKLWISDGSLAGTSALTTQTGASYSFYGMFDAANSTYFTFKKNTIYEIWKTDGTPAGTSLITSVPNTSIYSVTFLKNLGNLTFFTMGTTTEGLELWVTDGSAGGTMLLKDIKLGIADSNPTAAVVTASKFYFTADDGSTGVELWESDGTPSGTKIVYDINPGTESSSPSSFKLINGTIYFTALKNLAGRETWTYTP